MTGAGSATAAVGQLLVGVRAIGTGTAGTRVHRRTATIGELGGILGILLLLVVDTVLLMLMMLLLLLLVHVPFYALLAQHLRPLLAIAKGGIEERIGIPCAASAAQLRRLFDGIYGRVLEKKWNGGNISK